MSLNRLEGWHFERNFHLIPKLKISRGFDGDTQVMDIVSQTTDQDDDESTQEPEPQMDLSIDNDDDVVFTINESQVERRR